MDTIIIRGYLEGYKLSYVIEGDYSVVTNSKNAYHLRIYQEDIDKSIWKPEYQTKTISFYNNTTKTLETRLLRETKEFYYAVIPVSVLTTKGYLYLTINFFNEETGVVTKEMDNPIYIINSTKAIEELPTYESKDIIREEIVTVEKQIEIPVKFRYIENYKSLLQVFFEGKLLSEKEYFFEGDILVLNDSIYFEGGRLILLLQIPCDCTEGGMMASYASEAGRLRNSLFIGEIEYNGEKSVPLPPIPNAAVEYITQELEEAQQAIARKNISAAKVTIGEEPSNPQVGDIWVTESDTNLYALPYVATTDNNKVLTVVNGEWKAKLPETQNNLLPTIEAKDNGKFLQAMNGKWETSDISSRLMQDPSTMIFRDNSLHTYAIDPIKQQWIVKSVRELYAPQFAEITLAGGDSWNYNEAEGVYRQSISVINITADSVLLATPGSSSYFTWTNNSMSLEEYSKGFLVFKSYARVLEEVQVNLIYFGEHKESNTLQIFPKEEE